MSIAASFEVIDGWGERPGKLLFNPILYNENAFIGLKDYHSLKTFLALDQSGQILARIRFAKPRKDSAWISLPGAPFGGLEASPEFDATAFLSYVRAQFSNETKIEIIASPNFYGDHHQSIIDAGVTIFTEEINHHVDLTSRVSLHTMEQRRLRKAVNAGCTFRKYPLDAYGAIRLHSFISKCRAAQSLQVNISEQGFTKAIEIMAYAYHAYAVELEDRIIAATVLVRVTDDIMYNYLPASDKAYHHLSPMVLLMSELYEVLKNEGFRVLDWGVTSIDGDEQVSLARFKEAMGAVSGRKNSYLWS